MDKKAKEKLIKKYNRLINRITEGNLQLQADNQLKGLIARKRSLEFKFFKGEEFRSSGNYGNLEKKGIFGPENWQRASQMAEPLGAQKYSVLMVSNRDSSIPNGLLSRIQESGLSSGQFLANLSRLEAISFSGVLLRRGTEHFVLTSGHAFPNGTAPQDYFYFVEVTTIPSPLPVQVRVLRGTSLEKVSYGGYGKLDYAIVKVECYESGENCSLGLGDGYNSKLSPATIPDTESNLDCFSHPLGFQLLYERRPHRPFHPWNDNYKDDLTHSYFHCYLDVAEGCSGAPVWDKSGNLLGIVSSAGNLLSSLINNSPLESQGKLSWNRLETIYNGTQVVRWSEIQKEWEEKDRGLEPVPRGTVIDFPPGHSIQVNHERAYFMDNGTYTNADPISLSSPVTLCIINNKLRYEQNHTLENYCKDASPGSPRPIIGEVYWPFEWLIQDKKLEICWSRRFPHPSPIPLGQEVAILGGIGTTDIIDELPDIVGKKMNVCWLIEGSPIEITAVPRRQAIRIRYFEGITDVFRRQLP